MNKGDLCGSMAANTQCGSPWSSPVGSEGSESTQPIQIDRPRVRFLKYDEKKKKNKSRQQMTVEGGWWRAASSALTVWHTQQQQMGVGGGFGGGVGECICASSAAMHRYIQTGTTVDRRGSTLPSTFNKYVRCCASEMSEDGEVGVGRLGWRGGCTAGGFAMTTFYSTQHAPTCIAEMSLMVSRRLSCTPI